jgi:hypothetical protein
MPLGIIGKIVAPLAVMTIGGSVTMAISLNSRVSAQEAKQVDQAAHVEHIEKRLDAVDDHMNQALQSLGRIEGELNSSK